MQSLASRVTSLPVVRLAILGAALAAGATVAAQKPGGELTTERLRNADKEPENWLHYGGTYRSLRYSALDKINTKNVSSLQAAWAFNMGTTEWGYQATPLVADGVMYAIGTNHRVFAIDAATGAEKWRYFYEKKSPAASVSRGLAIGHGHVYFGTNDNYMVALDINTGKEVWRTLVHDPKLGCSLRAAPLVVNDMVVTGSLGGDQAHRGHLSAYDAKTGKQRWWFNVIPGPGEKGNDTWPGDTWMYGGGAPWMTGSYDPDLNLLYWGTSNPSSDFYGEERRGDNLYTNSIIALKPETGEIVWHYQTIPNDVWDYDAAFEQILADIPVNGRPHKVLMHPGKNGYIYVLDRTNGKFINAFKYVDNVTWTSGLDENGRPKDRLEPSTEKAVQICPGPTGARGFNQATFSPKTGLLYNTGFESCMEIKSQKQEMVPGRAWLGGMPKTVPAPGKVGLVGHIDAYDPLTGKRVWRVETRHPMLGALLSTAGDVLFAGDPEGNFNAFDAKTGKKLWSFQTGSGHTGGPISYSINGRQFIATGSGFGSYFAGTLGEFFPELRAARQGSTIFAFALPERR